MKETERQRGLTVAAGTLGLSGLIMVLSGCATTGGGGGGGGGSFAECQANVNAGLAVITCQPMDTSALIGGSASFTVQARGNRLSYTWYQKTSTHDFEPIGGATSATLSIANVQESNYGIYICAVGSEGPRGVTEVQTRWATLGKKFGGAGGNLMPIEDPVIAGSSILVCGRTVVGKKVRFDGTQTPPTGETSFQGGLNIVNADQSRTPVDNSRYLLQFFYNVTDAGCCTPMTGNTTTVSRSVTAGRAYTVTVWWIRNIDAPPLGTVIELQGAWRP